MGKPRLAARSRLVMMAHFRWLVPVTLAAAALVAACGGGSDSPRRAGAGRVTGSAGTTSATGGAGGQVDDAACEDGTIRDCSVDLGTFDGVHSCFSGQQLCHCAAWGPCVEPADLYIVGGTCGGGGAAGVAGSAGEGASTAAAGRSDGGGAAGVI
jgi:hypothetical protein